MAEAQEQEEPLNEAKAGKILDTIYEKALNGIPMVSHSVDEIADDYLSHHDTPEAAARSLARWQVAKCGTSGFLSGLGGIVTLPVTVPANIGSVIYVQMRMIAAIAKMGGYDVNSDQVQTMVYMCLTGSTIADIVKETGIQIGTKSLTAAIKKIPGSVLTKINQKIGFRFLTKFGEKGAINLGKLVPIAGGLIGGALMSPRPSSYQETPYAYSSRMKHSTCPNRPKKKLATQRIQRSKPQTERLAVIRNATITGQCLARTEHSGNT